MYSIPERTHVPWLIQLVCAFLSIKYTTLTKNTAQENNKKASPSPRVTVSTSRVSDHHSELFSFRQAGRATGGAPAIAGSRGYLHRANLCAYNTRRNCPQGKLPARLPWCAWPWAQVTSLSSVSFDNRYTSGSRFLVFFDFNSSYFFRKSSGVRENSAILTSKEQIQVI